jgi:hypothetical protein
MQNGFVGFNGRLRDECLNEQLFTNLGEARSSSKNGGSTTILPTAHEPQRAPPPLSSQHAPIRGKTGTDSPYERGQVGEQVSSSWNYKASKTFCGSEMSS